MAPKRTVAAPPPPYNCRRLLSEEEIQDDSQQDRDEDARTERHEDTHAPGAEGEVSRDPGQDAFPDEEEHGAEQGEDNGEHQQRPAEPREVHASTVALARENGAGSLRREADAMRAQRK